MKKELVTIRLENGLEARPVARLVSVASEYRANSYIEVNEKRVNAKSIMGMMSLGLDIGEKVLVITEGEDEEEALNGLKAYLSGN